MTRKLWQAQRRFNLACSARLGRGLFATVTDATGRPLSPAATMRRVRHRAFAGAMLLSAVVAAGPASAQRPSGGSVRVATDHWANEYVAQLRARGYLTALNPLVQPWRAADVARELEKLDRDTLPQPVRGWVSLLRSEFGWRAASDGPAVRGGGVVAAGVRASTSQRLDALRPLGEEEAWPRMQAGGWFEAGPVSADLRLLGDTYFDDDPDGLDPGQRRGARSDVAYLAVDFPVASVELGRFARNWSLQAGDGLMVSDVATPYPQFGFEVRAWRLALRSFTGELESISGRKRYVSAHRLDYETENLVLSFGEATLYRPESGSLSLRFLNPVEFLFFDQDNAPYDAQQNLMLSGQVWWSIRPVVLSGEFLLDDIDVAPTTDVAEPLVYALMVNADLPSLRPWLGLGARYQQVSAWAYRAYDDTDQYSYLDRGLGDNFSDFDRFTLSADLFPPVPGLRLTPTLQFQRQGEGDFRDSIPDAGYAGEPALFLGVVERTFRAALRGRYQPVRFAWVGWDVGYNWIRNRDHVQDAAENLFSAVAEVGVRINLPFRSGT